MRERRARGGRVVQRAGPRPPSPVPSQTPGRVWRGVGLGRGPRGGAGGPDKGSLGCAAGQGERSLQSRGGPGGGAWCPGRGGRGRGLAPGAGRPREGWGWLERAALSRGLSSLASGRLRAGAERASERSGPGHGAAGGGRAAAGAGAARAAARGECAGRRGRRRPGPLSPPPPTWLGRRGCAAGTLARDGGARQGPRAGTGRRHPPPWGCPEGHPGDPATDRGRGRPSWEPVGRPATLLSLRLALGMARPAIPGGQAEKLLAGWELGRARTRLSLPA